MPRESVGLPGLRELLRQMAATFLVMKTGQVHDSVIMTCPVLRVECQAYCYFTVTFFPLCM